MSGHPTLAVVLMVSVWLTACAQPQRVPDPGPTGRVALIATEAPAPEARQLDVGVRVFANHAEDRESLPINAATLQRIREVETHYLPVELRNTLVASNQWGVVRVLPEDDPSVDVLVHGTIIESDGEHLAVHVTAVDSSGRAWLDQTYRGRAFSTDYPDVVPRPPVDQPVRGLQDPFRDVYAQIANDLLLTRMALHDQELAGLRRISEMKHARDLSPEAFGDMLRTDSEGHLDVHRLPAVNDPIFDRVQAILERHHAFIDTVDGYYGALHRDLKPLYDLWRQYANDHQTQRREQPARDHGAAGHDSFGALRRSYDRYRWAKTFEQEFVGLASGFVSETAPAMLEMYRKLNGLTGSVEELYAQWRVLLRKMYEVDTGGVTLRPAGILDAAEPPRRAASAAAAE